MDDMTMIRPARFLRILLRDALDARDCGEDVHLEHLTQALERNERQGACLSDGGVRDENVEIPLVELGQFIGLRDVQPGNRQPWLHLGKVRSLLLVQNGGDHLVTTVGELNRGTAAETASRSGDEDGLCM
jgi:hypothetical protein